MGKRILHFMWGFQPHYRIHVRVQAEHVLEKLDNALAPEVFLVGILREATEGKFPACVEPENDCWIESEAFNGVLDLASSLQYEYPEAKIIQSHPLAQVRSNEALFKKSVRDAILQTIEQHPARPPKRSFFASWPNLVGEYLVSAVLSVETDVLESYHRLSTSTVPLHEYRNFEVARSLIDASIRELLEEAAEGLLRPNPGLDSTGKRSDEILRSAARGLAADTAFRADPSAVLGVHGFFDAICTISSLRYEKAEGHGNLVLACKDHKAIRKRLAFADAIGIQEHRRARKLLELASNQSAIHINSEKIFALVDAEIPPGNDEDIFVIRIIGHHHWQLVHCNQVLMDVRYGEPSLPQLAGYDSKLREDLPRLFPGIPSDACELLVSLVKQAEQERHGTTLVISGKADLECDRLRKQATPIEPCILTPKLLGDLTGIDGAVLLDRNGQCYAIGVILDGLATEQGDPSRGARFNSAIRYVQSADSRKISTLVVVISEDGGIDFIPDRRPRMKRSALTDLINEMDAISSVREIPIRRYNQIYDQLWKLRFYLLTDDCTRLNIAVRAIEERLNADNPNGIHLVRQDFVPDKSMQPSFYYKAEEES